MERLNKQTLNNLKGEISAPSQAIFNLPEKVLQFGTGVLLRGLPDYYIDKANRNGVYNGRVVVVKSTDSGDSSVFDHQDNLYTICVRGIEDGEKKEENIISSAISRVISAASQWNEVLAIAASPELELIISNTTEVGIQLLEGDDVNAQPPASYPVKLLAVLYHRYKTYNGSKDKGVIIIPTELLPDNAIKLRDILVAQAKSNNLPEEFISWMTEYNHFCNSLVDRIVPGKPDNEALAKLEEELGYKDNLLTMSEVYSLWAIEGDDYVKSKLTFAQVDKGVIITPDINLHRELKLRLLNGTHTLSSGVAFLAGCDTVKEAMDDTAVASFIETLMKNEIAPAIPYDVIPELANTFADKVLDRFRNPHIKHQWISITMNYTSKLKMRVIPVLLNYFKKQNTVPELMAFGFASYILFMKGKVVDGKYYGILNNQEYHINDDKASYLADLWSKNGEEGIVEAVLTDTELWGADLTALPGFADAVQQQLEAIQQNGVKEQVNSLGLAKTGV